MFFLRFQNPYRLSILKVPPLCRKFPLSLKLARYGKICLNFKRLRVILRLRSVTKPAMTLTALDLLPLVVKNSLRSELQK